MTNTILNSTLALTSAWLVNIMLHEGAHYIMSEILGYETVLFHNRIDSQVQDNKMHAILIAGIGPLFSLVLGAVACQWSKKMKAGPEPLFVLWLGIAGIITFFGYLMIAPIMTVGDTGKVFLLLDIPVTAQIIISILSVALLAIILIKSTDQFERFAMEDFGSVRANRKRWAVSLILFPLLFSVALVTLFQFPVDHFLSILATLCAPFSIMAIFGTFMGRQQELDRDLSGTSINDHISILLAGLFFVAVLINRSLVNGL